MTKKLVRRKLDQQVRIGDAVVTISEVNRGKDTVTLLIEAPHEVPIEILNPHRSSPLPLRNSAGGSSDR